MRSSAANTTVMKHFRITDLEIRIDWERKTLSRLHRADWLAWWVSPAPKVHQGPDSSTVSGTASAAVRELHFKHVQPQTFWKSWGSPALDNGLCTSVNDCVNVKCWERDATLWSTDRKTPLRYEVCKLSVFFSSDLAGQVVQVPVLYSLDSKDSSCEKPSKSLAVYVKTYELGSLDWRCHFRCKMRWNLVILQE